MGLLDIKPINAGSATPTWGPSPHGGLLSSMTPQNARTAAELLSLEPGLLGSIAAAGLTADDIRQGQYGSAALNALGMLPFVPAMGGMIRGKADIDLLNKLYAEQAIKRSEFYPSDITVTMSPEDYLKLTYPLEHTTDSRATIDEIKNVLSSSGKLNDVPYLSIDKKGKVVGQEGRHRATAMRELGMKEMPVVITGNSEMRATLRGMTKEQIAESLQQSLRKIKSQPNPRKTVEWE